MKTLIREQIEEAARISTLMAADVQLLARLEAVAQA